MKPDRVQVAPGVCEGRPTIRGVQVTLELVLKLIAGGYAADEARFAAWLAGQRTSAVA